MLTLPDQPSREQPTEGIWRAAVRVAGLVVIVIGIILPVAPGLGWLVIFLGLGIWAMELAWVRSPLRRVRRTVGE